MPFVPNTPESRLGRTDSLNPETTCRGITGSGKPCRRPLADSDGPSRPQTKPKQLTVDDPRDPDLYCWQHREQANASSHSSPGPPQPNPIRESRESIDTLMDRLGIVDTANKKNSRPRPSHDAGNNEKPSFFGRQKKRITLCCCFTFDLPTWEEEPEPPARPHPNPTSSPSAAGKKPSGSSSGKSGTSQYLSLIPPSTSPDTATALMAELAKGFSKGDEPGYIYIFWLTPESEEAEAPAEAARSFLAPPSQPRARQRRPSDVLESFSTRGGGAAKKKALLKIGRATNVQRRMNEWKRQCGYNLSLVRYYPHIPSDSTEEPRKMPHSHKVERLIHLELDGLGLRDNDRDACEACGRNHKEWFEVEASREGIAMVDEVIQRWSDWDETQG